MSKNTVFGLKSSTDPGTERLKIKFPSHVQEKKKQRKTLWFNKLCLKNIDNDLFLRKRTV